MDVFDLRGRLAEDYARHTRSFIKIADPGICENVEAALREGAAVRSTTESEDRP